MAAIQRVMLNFIFTLYNRFRLYP